MTTKQKNVIFFPLTSKAGLSGSDLKKLTAAARHSPNKRARFCLHKSLRDPRQEMVIAFCRGTYVRPHRQSGGYKTYHVIKGKLRLIFFDRQGRVTARIELAHRASKKAFIYRFKAKSWHTVIPQSPTVIIHESVGGPYRKTAFASWSPDGNYRAAIRKFLKRI